MSTLKDFGGSRAAIRSAMCLSRRLSPPAARCLVRSVAGLVAHGRSALYQAILINQAHVRGLRLDDPALPATVKDVIVHAGQGYYDQFRSAALGRPAPVKMDERSRNHLLDAVRSRRGVLAVGAHLSSFDLAIQHITASNQVHAYLLSLAQPTAGFLMLNELRANPYCTIAPINRAALRTAIQHLRDGRLVGTGVDRPVQGQMVELSFFGRPARLPIGHIRLALKTGALVVPLWCEWTMDQGYRVRIAPPMEMEPLPDVDDSIRHNAQRVLSVFEPPIARRPEQWMMFLPVWPIEESTD
jgi:phosphatidylinositol dimannoside acyltransferase